jgi:small subunit ribosomal protein S16
MNQSGFFYFADWFPAFLEKLAFFAKFRLSCPTNSTNLRTRPQGAIPKRHTMSVSLRLNRKGTKDRPYYKIVAVDSRKRRDGRYIEQIGTYNPLVEGTNYEIDLAKADKWLAVGAKPSETVNSFIRKARTAATK